MVKKHTTAFVVVLGKQSDARFPAAADAAIKEGVPVVFMETCEEALGWCFVEEDTPPPSPRNDSPPAVPKAKGSAAGGGARGPDNNARGGAGGSGGGGAGGSGGASVDVGINPPVNPAEGNIWLNSETGRLYVYIIDEDSTTTWVQPSVPIANSFVNIAFDDSTQFSAGLNDTLTLLDGPGIEISSNAIDKSLTISSTIETFSGNYNDLLNIPVEYSGVNLKSTTESLVTITNTTGTVDHDFSQSSIFYHDQLLTNFTINFTNIPETAERTISAVLVLDQSNTAYIPIALEIDGQAQTIRWQGASSPSGIANQINIVSFTLIRQNNQWTVLGSFSTYG